MPAGIPKIAPSWPLSTTAKAGLADKTVVLAGRVTTGRALHSTVGACLDRMVAGLWFVPSRLGQIAPLRRFPQPASRCARPGPFKIFSWRKHLDEPGRPVALPPYCVCVPSCAGTHQTTTPPPGTTAREGAHPWMPPPHPPPSLPAPGLAVACGPAWQKPPTSMAVGGSAQGVPGRCRSGGPTSSLRSDLTAVVLLGAYAAQEHHRRGGDCSWVPGLRGRPASPVPAPSGR